MQKADTSPSNSNESRDTLTSDMDRAEEAEFLKSEQSDDDDACTTSEPTTFTKRMKRIGISQMLIAITCVAISIPLIIEVDKRSAGSGIWCSIFFATMGGLNFTFADKLKSFKAMLTFSATSLYFGVLMLCVELIEFSIPATATTKTNTTALVLHVVLCSLALSEILLTILAIIICYKENKVKCRKNLTKSFVKPKYEVDRRSSDFLFSGF
uniref:MARVEL domain-containing protein n=1 Tax=Ciona savignyi TaxID=51511 RepID=H2YP81_CIOSA